MARRVKKDPPKRTRKKRGPRRPRAVRYHPKPGSRVSKEQAQRLGPLIATLQAEGAINVPKALVDVARDPANPAHRDFEWDESRAAEEYRLIQARRYIGSIEIDVIIQRQTIRTQAYVPTFRNDGEYVPIGTALTDEDIMSRLLLEAMRALDGWRRRFERLKHMAEMKGLFAAIDRALEKRDADDLPPT